MDINANTVVEVGGKKVSLGVLLQSATALGIQPGAPKPEKPVRKIVTTTKATPSSADALAKAAAALTPGAGLTVATTPASAASAKTYEDVTITITKEFVPGKDGAAPVEMFVLCKRCPSPGGKGKPRKGEPMSHYNYRFDKGFTGHHTYGAGKPGWKWDPKREVKFVPLDALETLLQGLRECYTGAKLIIGDQIVTL